MTNKSFATKQQYLAFREAFRELAHNKQISAEDLVILHILRGKDAYFGFCPIKNANKLACNCSGNPWFNHKLLLQALDMRLDMTRPQPVWAQQWKEKTNLRFNKTITNEAWQFLSDYFHPTPVKNTKTAEVVL